MITVVTPTLCRPQEVAELVRNLSQQTCLPGELILVDGAPEGIKETFLVVQQTARQIPFPIHYIRNSGGTAIQRNTGIVRAAGDFIAFIDDDIRLEPDFFEQILKVFNEDRECRVGGITGYIVNQFLDPEKSPRWRMYKKLRLHTTYEPGRYDFQTGSPINRYLQPPHNSLREIDFMGAGCVVWRKQVFEKGLCFSEFFTGYGILEDAHFALRAGKDWRLLENGRARCVHLQSPVSRINNRQRMRIAAINHRYVFMDIVPKRTWRQEYRFWRLHLFEIIRLTIYAILHNTSESWMAAIGKMEGVFAAWKMRQPEGDLNI